MLYALIADYLQLRTSGWGLKKAVYPEIQEILLRLHFLRYSKEPEVLLEPQDFEGVPEILADKIKVTKTTPLPAAPSAACVGSWPTAPP